jgi:membrane protein
MGVRENGVMSWSRALGGALRWLGRLLAEVWSSWHRHRCTQLGAALAFYGIFSFPPLLLLFASVFGYFLASWAGAAAFKDSLAGLISNAVSPQVSRIAIEAISATENARSGLGLIGLATLLIAATGAFGAMESSMQVVWDVHVAGKAFSIRKHILGYLRMRLAAFLLVCGVSLLVFFSLVIDVFLDAYRKELIDGLRADWRLAQLAMGFFSSGLIVTLLYRWLPARRVPWRAALAGGWLTAILWEVAKQGLSLFLRRNDYGHAYPVLGSALAFLIWVYYAMLVYLLGGEVAAAITRMTDPKPPGSVPQDRPGLVQAERPDAVPPDRPRPAQ